MNIVLNGTPTEVADACCMSDLLERLALSGQRFAVEVNAELVPRSRFGDHRLNPGDRVEVIQAVGGG